MNTLNKMKESINNVFNCNTIKAKVIIQKARTLKTDDTIEEVVLPFNYACKLFGDYELLHNDISIYTKEINIFGEKKNKTFDCIMCVVYVPIEDKKERK